MADDIIGINIAVKGTRSVTEAQRELERMKKSLLQVALAERQGTLAAGSLDKATQQFTKTLQKKTGDVIGSTRAAHNYKKALKAMSDQELASSAGMSASTKSIRQFQLGMQQAGYQVQDFIVQVQAGTNPLVAFSQQGSQLAGFFAGPWGAMIGVGIAAVSSLGMAFMATMEQAKSFEDGMSDAADAASILDDALEALDDPAIDEVFGRYTTAIKSMSEATSIFAKQLANLNLASAMSSLTSGLDKEGFLGTGFFGGTPLGKAIFGKRPEEVLSGYGLSEETVAKIGTGGGGVGQIFSNLQALYQSGNVTDVLDETNRILNAVKESGDQLSVAGLEFFLNLDKGARQLADLEASFDGSAKNAEVGRDIAEETLQLLTDMNKADKEAYKEAVKKREENQKWLEAQNRAIQLSGKTVGLEGEQLFIAKQQVEQLQLIEKLKERGIEVTEGEGLVLFTNLKKLQEGELLAYRQAEAEKAKEKAAKGYNKKLREQQRLQKELEKKARVYATTMENGLMSIADGTKSVKDAFRDMARDIIAHLYKVLVVQRLVRSFGGMLAGSSNAAVADIGKGLQTYGSANGNVFNQGSIVPYANGGVVGGPTYFPMSGGKTGLMGEAGPEAIMPLKRGKDGKLGVAADGGGGVTINQTFAFQANGDDSVKKIIAQAAPKIAAMTQQQIMDSRRRGGQMKQVFG